MHDLAEVKAAAARLRAASPDPGIRRPGKVTQPQPDGPAPDCVHRGGVIGLSGCAACTGGNVELIACAVKGACTADPKKMARGVQRCQTCRYEPKVPPS